MSSTSSSIATRRTVGLRNPIGAGPGSPTLLGTATTPLHQSLAALVAEAPARKRLKEEEADD
jgi:hypothetical protein